MKISKVSSNSREEDFSVSIGSDGATFFLPYSACNPKPSASNPVVEVFVAPKSSSQAFTYVLRSGQRGSVSADRVVSHVERTLVEQMESKSILKREQIMFLRSRIETVGPSLLDFLRRPPGRRLPAGANPREKRNGYYTNPEWFGVKNTLRFLADPCGSPFVNDLIACFSDAVRLAPDYLREKEPSRGGTSDLFKAAFEKADPARQRDVRSFRENLLRCLWAIGTPEAREFVSTALARSDDRRFLEEMMTFAVQRGILVDRMIDLVPEVLLPSHIEKKRRGRLTADNSAVATYLDIAPGFAKFGSAVTRERVRLHLVAITGTWLRRGYRPAGPWNYVSERECDMAEGDRLRTRAKQLLAVLLQGATDSLEVRLDDDF